MRSLVLFSALASPCFSQEATSTFVETRKWLMKAEVSPANDALKKLFMKGDERMDDLIQALGDKKQKVSLNAQRVIRYLADVRGLAGIDNRKNWCREACSSPIMNVLAQPKELVGTEDDPLWIAKKNLKVFQAAEFNSGDVSLKLIGYNKRTRVALFEVIQGQVFTAGWQSALRFKDGRWWLISDSNIWVH
jgi:hypothetical protein